MFPLMSNRESNGGASSAAKGGVLGLISIISPLSRNVYELSTQEHACRGCGVERKEIGAEESWRCSSSAPFSCSELCKNEGVSGHVDFDLLWARRRRASMTQSLV